MHSADHAARQTPQRRLTNAAMLLFLAALLAGGGCVQVAARTGYGAYERRHAKLAPGEFAGRIDQLLNQADSRHTADSHLQLGLLYLHSNNPRPDFAAALVELDAYQQVAGADAASEVTSLLGLLRRFQEQALELKATRLDLASHEAASREEISRLRGKLRQIQRLDMQIEKKRRDMK